MKRTAILLLGITLLFAADLLLAGKPKPGPMKPRTDLPTLQQPTIGPLGRPEEGTGTIKPAAGLTPPPGSCSQITITAWRNDAPPNPPGSGVVFQPREMVHATGASLALCQYSISVPRQATVKLVSSTTIPGWKVVTEQGDTSTLGGFTWQDQAFVPLTWFLRPIVLPRK